jgi:hypothetical protein
MLRRNPMRLKSQTRRSLFRIYVSICCTAVASVSPIAAGIESSTPLARAVARETARLAADPQTDSSSVAWSRVLPLAAGTEIVVTSQDAVVRNRIFVTADEFCLTLLNLADLPTAVERELRRVASTHPEYLVAAHQRGTVIFHGNLRLQRDGAYVGNRRVADFGQVIERIERTGITEIAARRWGRGFWGHLGPLGGVFVGAMSAGMVVGYACQAMAGRVGCDSAAALGLFVGGIGGGAYGFHAARRETEEVVYLAPQAAR